MQLQTFQLINGVHIPKICLGTNITLPVVFGADSFKASLKAFLGYFRALIRPQDYSTWGKVPTIKATRTLSSIVKEASAYGIFAFDTSRSYGGSERRLAKGLNGRREDIFIITKIDDHSQFLGQTEKCLQTSLNQLKTDYVDLLLLHWPVDYPAFPDERFFDNGIPVYARSWKTLENIYKDGGARAIGVSNFSVRQLETLKKYAEIMPMANEFECHPLCIRKELNHYCAENKIQVLAFSALRRMDSRLMVGKITEIANTYNKSVAQVILRWHIQNDRIPIFGTTQKDRLSDYAQIFDFELMPEELDIIDNYNINYRGSPDSERCDFTKGIWVGWEDYKDCCP